MKVKTVVRKKTKKVTSIQTRLVHRMTKTGNHRLELHNLTEAPKIGDWSPFNSVAQLENYRGTTEAFKGILPKIFRISDATAFEVVE